MFSEYVVYDVLKVIDEVGVVVWSSIYVDYVMDGVCFFVVFVNLYDYGCCFWYVYVK
jgi:hypothetical protein